MGVFDDDELSSQVSEGESSQSDFAGLFGSGDSETDRETETLVEIKMPRKAGLSFSMWKSAINNACLLHRFGRDINLENLDSVCKDVPRGLLEYLLGNDQFSKALEMRGAIEPNSTVGLTEKQILTLNMLTNFADTRSIDTKLRSAGIKKSEFQQWLGRDTKFKRMYRALSEDLFDHAQAAVNVATVQGAVNGDIRFVKYFNEMTGRWDPSTQQSMDVQVLLRGIAEILTSTIHDPELLRQIGGKLAILMGTTPGIEDSTSGSNEIGRSASDTLSKLNAGSGVDAEDIESYDAPGPDFANLFS